MNERFNIQTKVDRRRFLRRGGLAGLGLGSMAATLANLKMMSEATASQTSVGSDYKALVCFFLNGGCDTNNVVIPIGNNPQADNYKLDRGVAGIPETQADAIAMQTQYGLSFTPEWITGADGGAGTEINSPSPTDQQFGLHPSLKTMASMFNQGNLAFVTNCGTLAEQTTAGNYNNAVLPIQLFSHADQVNQWFSSVPQNPFVSGWAGRIADLFEQNNTNPEAKTSMLITAAGNTDLLVSPGGTVPQYSVTTTGAIPLTGYGTNYAGALDGNGKYDTNSTGRRLRAFEAIMNYNHSHVIEQGYNTVVKRARGNEETIGAAVAIADTNSGASSNPGPFPTDNYLDNLFVTTYNTLRGTNFTQASQLPNDVEEMLIIAKLITGRKCLGNNRQVFFMNKGGFDNHQDINDDLPGLLGDVDAIVACFDQAMQDLAQYDPDFDYNMVTTFQASDFNRTWTPNGDDYGTSGTDHAWGTHTWIFGGAVEDVAAPSTGKLYGFFPELAVGGADDVPQGNRGRWIPTTATDQYYARLANWFGVSTADLSGPQGIFPNLDEFVDPFNAAANLDFIGTT
ncbi:MAG: DUF1501 domain-containing protein [Verrucomicrobiota bacterium]